MSVIGWVDIGVLTRAVKTLSHVTEDPGETKILKPLPRVAKVFLKLEIDLATAFLGGLGRSEGGDSGNGVGRVTLGRLLPYGFWVLGRYVKCVVSNFQDLILTLY